MAHQTADKKTTVWLWPGTKGTFVQIVKDRRLVYCLLCCRPQEALSSHLARVCMKGSTPEERNRELKKAKESTKAWCRHGRNWDYNHLCKIIPHRPSRHAVLQHLLDRNFFVANAPNKEDMVVEQQQQQQQTNTEEPSTSTAATASSPLVSTATENSSSSGEEPASRDPEWQKPSVASCSGVRISMQQLGLYQKFPSSSEILLEFKRYLMDHLEVPNCQQEVDNVARMLRFMQPNGDTINMDFLNKSTETKDFIMALKTAKLAPATILNYLKNMIRFISFLMTREIQDHDFRRSCVSYIELLNTLRKPVSKSHSKMVCKTRYDRFVGVQRTVAECQKLLREAKKDMLNIFGCLQEGKVVSSEERTNFRYYCEAIIILGHFQRPGVVEGMTVQEWLKKKLVDGRVCVGVGKHKTATMQIASFALTMEESAMLDAYYMFVRPDNVHENVADEGRLFLSQSGTPIRSATNDLGRLHAHYKLPNVTSQEIRRSVETAVAATCTEEQKSQVAHYMAHSTAVANAHYRMRTQSVDVVTANILSSVSGYSSDESVGGRGLKRGRDTEEKKDFADFIQAFPVSLTGQAPSKKQRVDAGFPADRLFYDRWRAAQFGKREEYLLSNFHRRPPTERQVQSYVEKEGWTANYPRPDTIAAKWRPPMKRDVETDQHIIRNIVNQKWSGLSLTDFEDARGQGVVATKPFPKGSVICDYHGKLMTADEGRKIMKDSNDDMGYMFFFSSGGQKLCIDAQTNPCECHPQMETTIGRKINHSRKNPNVKPSKCKINFPDGRKPTIILVASRDIKVNEELRFDYGVNRNSFRGEGLDLHWLDE